MKRFQVALLALSLVFCALAAWAADVGKISGKIVDAKSGDPIPSVNVMILGTSMGASTSVEGDFFILNIPIGLYDVRVTSVGYETQKIENVQIFADRTYELNIKLNETVIEGKEITVIAERDIIKRDITTTTKALTPAEIQALPVISYQDALSKTAGVVGSGTNIHVRGGRREEILYLVDGLAVKDPQFQRRSLSISRAAIGEMQVLSAGFDAEYGEAQSAVVNLVVQEGEPKYHGRIEHVMDFAGIEKDENGRDHYQDYDYTEASVSGPDPITQELLPRWGVKIPGILGLFASGTVWSRNTDEFGTLINTDRWYRHQVTDVLGMDVRKNEANSNSNLKLTYKPSPSYKISLGWNQAQSWANPYWFRMSRRFPDDFTPEERTLAMQALATLPGLASDAANYNQVFGTDDDGDRRIDEEVMNGADDDGDGLVDEDLQYYSFNANNSTRTDRVRDQQFFATFTHNLTAKTFYAIRLSRYEASRTQAGGNKAANEYGMASESFTDLPGQDGTYNHRYDIGEPFTDRNGNGMWDFNNPTNATSNVNGFYVGGYGLAGNYQQLVPDWSYFSSTTNTFKFDLTSQLDPKHLFKGGVEYNYYEVNAEDRPYPSVSDSGAGTYTDIYSFYPSSGAAYIQDKMEYRDIIVNAGLRADFWRIGGNSIRNPLARQGLQNYVDYTAPSKSVKTYLSPRLGIAYSVTENDVFHFNYGYFYQRGRQDFYFSAVNQLQTGGTPIIGNPDLDPMKTISYELGVRHQFAEDFLLDASTYYKDIKNWIQTASQNQLEYDLHRRIIVGSNAAIYYNADYASVRGFEFNLSKDYGSELSGRLTYTIAWATGKNSYDIGSDVTRSNYVDPKRETPLAWDRRHQIVFNLGYHNQLKGRPFSAQWLSTGWAMNVISQALSGLPYTPTNINGTDVEGKQFAERSPWTYSTDLNVSREFRYAKLNWRLLVEVRNLFNSKNPLGWDRNNYTMDTYNNGTPGYINDNSSPNYGLNPKSGANPDAWEARRLIRVGLGVEF